MKKWKIVAILTILFCMLPFCAALAKTGKVTASALNMREKANSKSDVVRVLHRTIPNHPINLTTARSLIKRLIKKKKTRNPMVPAVPVIRVMR